MRENQQDEVREEMGLDFSYDEREMPIHEKIKTTILIAQAKELKELMTSVTSQMHGVVDKVARILYENGYDQEEAKGISAVLYDVISNKVFHGNFKVPSDIDDKPEEAKKQIEKMINNGIKVPEFVTFDLIHNSNNEIQITVEDQGETFDWQALIQNAYNYQADIEKYLENPASNTLPTKGIGTSIMLKKLGENNIFFENGGRRIIIKIPLKEKQI